MYMNRTIVPATTTTRARLSLKIEAPAWERPLLETFGSRVILEASRVGRDLTLSELMREPHVIMTRSTKLAEALASLALYRARSIADDARVNATIR
jgi:hypothetical protein